MEKIKYLIIGAGISGLSAAHYLKKDYTIIEKSDSIGGYCRTIRQDGFIWDYSGHFLHFKDQAMGRHVRSILKKDLLSAKKDSKIFIENKYIDFPFQMNFHQLGMKGFLQCFIPMLLRKRGNVYESYKDMLAKKFGKGICEKFLYPYNEKLYAVDLNKLDVDAMGRFFPYVSAKDVLKKIIFKMGKSFYNDNILYPKNGIMQLLEKLAEGKEIMFNTELKEIDIDGRIAKTSDGEIKYDYLINTMPLNRFYPMIRSQIRQDPGDLSYNKVLVFNFGFIGSTKIRSHWIYYPEKPYRFYRVGFYSNILGTEKASIYVEIGFPKDGKIDIAKERKKALDGIQKSGIISKNALASEHNVVMDPAYVHLKKDTTQKVEALRQELKSKGIFTIGRYAEWSYISMEDCMLHAKSLAEEISH